MADRAGSWEFQQKSQTHNKSLVGEDRYGFHSRRTRIIFCAASGVRACQLMMESTSAVTMSRSSHYLHLQLGVVEALGSRFSKPHQCLVAIDVDPEPVFEANAQSILRKRITLSPGLLM